MGLGCTLHWMHFDLLNMWMPTECRWQPFSPYAASDHHRMDITLCPSQRSVPPYQTLLHILFQLHLVAFFRTRLEEQTRIFSKISKTIYFKYDIFNFFCLHLGCGILDPTLTNKKQRSDRGIPVLISSLFLISSFNGNQLPVICITQRAMHKTVTWQVGDAKQHYS